jgi:hypothetical protein
MMMASMVLQRVGKLILAQSAQQIVASTSAHTIEESSRVSMVEDL